MPTRIPLIQAEEERRTQAERLEMSTAEIGLSVRTTNCLEERGIFYRSRSAELYTQRSSRDFELRGEDFGRSVFGSRDRWFLSPRATSQVRVC